MAKVDLVVGIGAEYKGKPAFNKASKDVFGLNSGVRSLAKAYIGLAGAQKAFRYGQQSLKAFVADDKAVLTASMSPSKPIFPDFGSSWMYNLSFVLSV